MRLFFKSFFIAGLSLFLTSILVRGFGFPGVFSSEFVLMSLALMLVLRLVLPITSLFGLPRKGLSGLLIRFILSALTLYIVSEQLSAFEIISTFLPRVVLFGATFPAKHLSPVESLLASSLVFSIMHEIFVWFLR